MKTGCHNFDGKCTWYVCGCDGYELAASINKGRILGVQRTMNCNAATAMRVCEWWMQNAHGNPPPNPHAAALGRLGGKAKSKAKASAARANGKFGGWPKGKKRKPSSIQRL